MKRDGIQTLAWNEEYIITATKQTEHGTKKIKTPKGKGHTARFKAEEEKKRLKSEGYENIKISVQKWTENISMSDLRSIENEEPKLEIETRFFPDMTKTSLEI